MVNLRQTVLLATFAVLLIAQVSHPHLLNFNSMIIPNHQHPLIVSPLFHQVSMACQCGQGVDVCNCQPREIVRPRPLPAVACRGPRRVCQYVGGSTQYNPIGDVCSCTSTVVRPAPRACGPTCNCNNCATTPDNSEVIRRREERRQRAAQIGRELLACGCGYLNCLCNTLTRDRS